MRGVSNKMYTRAMLAAVRAAAKHKKINLPKGVRTLKPIVPMFDKRWAVIDRTNCTLWMGQASDGYEAKALALDQIVCRLATF